MSGFGLIDVVIILASALATGFAWSQADRAWAAVEKWRKGPPVKWQVRIYDPDGILIRTEDMSPRGIARLVEYINEGFLK